jgi:hypothetical protein
MLLTIVERPSPSRPQAWWPQGVTREAGSLKVIRRCARPLFVFVSPVPACSVDTARHPRPQGNQAEPSINGAMRRIPPHFEPDLALLIDARHQREPAVPSTCSLTTMGLMQHDEQDEAGKPTEQDADRPDRRLAQPFSGWTHEQMSMHFARHRRLALPLPKSLSLTSYPRHQAPPLTTLSSCQSSMTTPIISGEVLFSPSRKPRFQSGANGATV